MILYLGNNNNKVFNFLNQNYPTINTAEKITPKFIQKFDRVVSYGYRHILKKEHIINAKNPIINLHISYLPWNKGADPNYWSWIENTPKGVTIHHIDEGIDTGDILLQTQVKFNKNETLSSSYKKLTDTIEDLFIKNFENIINNKIKPTPQPKGGSIHYKKDFPGVNSWNINIKHLVK